MSRDQDDEFRSELEAAVAGFGLDHLSEQQTVRLIEHFAMIRRWNQRINLTRIIRPTDAARLHYAESLFGARFIIGERTVLDIGSGAGFPAIPLAVVRPDVQVAALEANHRKAVFLKEAKDTLKLANFKVVSARLGDFDWAGYQLLTSRALERAETIFPNVISSLRARQRLMLFCTRELVVKLKEQVGEECSVESHAIALSDERLVAIFSKV